MQQYEEVPIMIGGRRMSAILADTPFKQMLGLMERDKLGKGECMLFIFGTPARYSIWMRNMRFPIDVIWLDEKKRVVTIKENFKPARGFDFSVERPGKPSKFVIETEAGFVKKNKINRNTKISFG